MNIHKNARLTHQGRAHLLHQAAHVGLACAAAGSGVSIRTGHKWRRRFDVGGVAALQDRSSRPHHSPGALREEIQRWIRRLRRWCHWTMRKIARRLQISLTSVSRYCARWGLSRLRPPPEPPVRYEREHPGDLLHMDTKKLVCIGGRGAGREVVHVAIDDHSRVGFAKIYPDETKFSAIDFLEAAVKFYRGKGIRIRRLLTDNGSAYCSADFLAACEEHGIAKKFTRPYRPQTNGKAERFIQTCLREWIRPKRYATNKDRAKALKPWLKFYNDERPHSALGDQPPMSRVVNNVLKHNICIFERRVDLNNRQKRPQRNSVACHHRLRGCG